MKQGKPIKTIERLAFEKGKLLGESGALQSQNGDLARLLDAANRELAQARTRITATQLRADELKLARDEARDELERLKIEAAEDVA